MVIDTKKESININKLVCEKEETINVEGDMIVPDSKPDILNSINTSGNICVYKKELMDDKLKIDGSVNAYVMYIADNTQDRVRGINLNLDFSEILNAPNCRENMILDLITEIINIECNVINGRKINVKASLSVKFKVYTNESVEMINEIQDNNDIQILRNNINVNSLVGCGSTKAYVKDTLAIENSDNLAEILRVDIDMTDKDIKTSYNKVLAKTEAEIKILYLTEDSRIVTCTNKIPIVGFVDIQNVSEDNICDTNFEIRNMIVKPNSGDEHSIYVELEVEVSCMAYETKELNLLKDLYSPTCDLKCDKKEFVAIANKTKRVDTCHVKEVVNLPELSNEDLIDSYCMPKITKVNKQNSKIIFEGELSINFLVGTPETQVQNIMKIVPFDFAIDNIENGDMLNVNTNLEMGIQDFSNKTNGDVEIDADVIFNTDMYDNVDMSIINNIEETENRTMDDYSLVIYIVKSGDTLWNIAKKLNSTVDDIVRANGIENKDAIHPGEKLYVPKYYRRGVSEQAQIPTMMYA